MRVGHISYTNSWPITFGFPPEHWGGRVRVVRAKPNELNEMLAAGAVDVASVSAFAYARHADELVLLPDLSVSARGKVRSIFLFATRPLEERLPRRIAVTNTSATSINLLKILMFHRYDHQPEYVACQPVLEDMLKDCDAALLIGDEAIKASWRDQGLAVYDLGEMWRELTGLGMTFAVWVARREWAETHGRDLADIHRALVASKQWGLTLPEPMLESAIARIGGDRAFWKTYFSGLIYDFAETQMAGLEKFFELAHRIGLLARVPAMNVWRDPNQTRVNE